MLADHGAEVIRIERPGNLAVPNDPLARSRKSLSINLKSDEALAIVRQLARKADGLVEGYRPGVMERLGIGPDVLLEDNPKLVYGRVTGWGQEGPLAQEAGHDINYLALTGLLSGLGPKAGPPTAPSNYLADFAGGGIMLAFAMVAAFIALRLRSVLGRRTGQERRRTGGFPGPARPNGAADGKGASDNVVALPDRSSLGRIMSHSRRTVRCSCSVKNCGVNPDRTASCARAASSPVKANTEAKGIDARRSSA